MACRCKERRAALQRALTNPKTAKSEVQFVLTSAREDAGRAWRNRGKWKAKS